MPVKTPKPQVITIASVRRTRKTIQIGWAQAESYFDLEERDNPLPSFAKALDALTVVVAAICHLPAGYCSKGLRVVGIDVGEQGGAQTVAIACRKDISDAAKEFAFRTPERLLAHPDEEGQYTPPLSAAHAELVEDAIEEAKRYINGERAQGVIVFEEEGKPAEPAAGPELPLSEGAPTLTALEGGAGSKGEKTKKPRAKKYPAQGGE